MLKDKVTFIGLGACGSNIALLFQKKNYHTIFINGSEQDNKALSGARNILKLKGFDGCGGDRKKAEEALANNLEIIEEIRKIKEQVIYLVFSTAGSTGSGLAPILCDVLRELNEEENLGKTICCIAVLPKRNEALQKHINAYNCIKELAENDHIGSCILVDNNKLESLSKINSTLVSTLDMFFTEESYSARGNVDLSERMKMIEQRGVFLLSAVCNGKARGIELLESLFTKSIFAPVEPDGVVEYLAVINSLDEGIDIDAVMKAVGIPQNIFQGYGAKKTITILSGLSFPITYLSEIRENAEEQYRARMESRSVGKELQELNLNNTKQRNETKGSRPKVSRLDMLRRLKDTKN